MEKYLNAFLSVLLEVTSFFAVQTKHYKVASTNKKSLNSNRVKEPELLCYGYIS